LFFVFSENQQLLRILSANRWLDTHCISLSTKKSNVRYIDNGIEETDTCPVPELIT
jgi:hypothetical protein